MTQKIGYLLVGVSGSGKSTFVNKMTQIHRAEGLKVGVISMDTVRLQMYATAMAKNPAKYPELVGADLYAAAFAYANENDTSFKYALNDTVKVVLAANDVVFIDNMNHVRKARSRWVQDLRSKGFEVHAVQFMVSMDTLNRRQLSRGDKFLPPNRVRDIYMQVQELQVDEYDKLTFVDAE